MSGKKKSAEEIDSKTIYVRFQTPSGNAGYITFSETYPGDYHTYCDNFIPTNQEKGFLRDIAETLLRHSDILDQFKVS